MSHVKDVTFHLLTHEDAVELLQFERAERAWSQAERGTVRMIYCPTQVHVYTLHTPGTHHERVGAAVS